MAERDGASLKRADPSALDGLSFLVYMAGKIA
jgi:hypothetical protein